MLLEGLNAGFLAGMMLSAGIMSLWEFRSHGKRHLLYCGIVFLFLAPTGVASSLVAHNSKVLPIVEMKEQLAEIRTELQLQRGEGRQLPPDQVEKFAEVEAGLSKIEVEMKDLEASLNLRVSRAILPGVPWSVIHVALVFSAFLVPGVLYLRDLNRKPTETLPDPTETMPAG